MTSFAASKTGGLDDASLARAAAAGDRTAFAEIYDRYADRLHDFCVGMLRDRQSAADCVQDVFVTAATKLVQLREPDRLRSWLYAIARSEALARIRARKREQLSEELPEMPSGEADLATMAVRTELADLIKEASSSLSDRDQVVLELAYRQGLDGTELADALGVTARNANTLVERMRETIARSLGALLLCRRRSRPGPVPRTGRDPGWVGRRVYRVDAQAGRPPHRRLCSLRGRSRADGQPGRSARRQSPSHPRPRLASRTHPRPRRCPIWSTRAPPPPSRRRQLLLAAGRVRRDRAIRLLAAWEEQVASPPDPRCHRRGTCSAGYWRCSNAHRAGRVPRRSRQLAGIHDPVHHHHECESDAVGPRAHRAQPDAAASTAGASHDDPFTTETVILPTNRTTTQPTTSSEPPPVTSREPQPSATQPPTTHPS